MTHDFSLHIEGGQPVKSARRWLLLGVVALAIAGLFSLLIVAARTPAFATIPALKDFFRIALVVHVDLSVLVWFLAIAAMLWSLLGHSRTIPYISQAAFGCVGIGTLVLARAAFTSSPTPIMSNYIPVLMHPLFFLGLGLVLSGIVLTLLNLFTVRNVSAVPVGEGETAQRLGIYTSAVMALAAVAAFTWSAWLMPPGLQGQDYYEMLFWGGGHALQFVWVQLAVVSWLWLTSAMGLPVALPPKWLAVLYLFNLIVALSAPVAYLLYPVDSPEFRLFFTRAMILGNGVTPVAVAIPLLLALLRRRAALQNRALYSSLVMSLLLFGFGGALGVMISGQNVTIPAHYHGSIVGVTLAFMGLTYLLLPAFGFAPVSHTRFAFWQPLVYGASQFIHISALAYSGGYGVLRKTPGALEGGMSAAKIAMGVMGMGGMLAILGGLMFVIVVGRSVFQPGIKGFSHR